MPTRRSRWLLLDLGGVIEQVDDDARPTEFRTTWATRIGLTDEEFSRRLSAADLPPTDVQDGTETAYWDGVGRALEVSDATLTAMRADFWDGYCGTLNDELVDHLTKVRNRAGLAVLSNSGDGARREEERRFGLSRLFDPILYSHEIGVNKPDPRAYEIAIERLGVPAEKIMFIDDHLDNVEAATRLGLVGVHHTDNAASIAAINRFLSA